MIVHIGGSVRGAGYDLEFLRTIANEIHKSDGQIALNWFEASNYKVEKNNGKKFKANWTEIVAENARALRRADAFIAEVTTYRLYHGYELANALNMKKPVLLVSRAPLTELAVSGVKDSLLTMQEYKDTSDLAGIVHDFLDSIWVPSDKSQIKIKIDAHMRQELQKRAEDAGKSISEVAQELIRQKAAKELSS